MAYFKPVPVKKSDGSVVYRAPTTEEKKAISQGGASTAQQVYSGGGVSQNTSKSNSDQTPPSISPAQSQQTTTAYGGRTNDATPQQIAKAKAEGNDYYVGGVRYSSNQNPTVAPQVQQVRTINQPNLQTGMSSRFSQQETPYIQTPKDINLMTGQSTIYQDRPSDRMTGQSTAYIRQPKTLNENLFNSNYVYDRQPKVKTYSNIEEFKKKNLTVREVKPQSQATQTGGLFLQGVFSSSNTDQTIGQRLRTGQPQESIPLFAGTLFGFVAGGSGGVGVVGKGATALKGTAVYQGIKTTVKARPVLSGIGLGTAIPIISKEPFKAVTYLKENKGGKQIRSMPTFEQDIANLNYDLTQRQKGFNIFTNAFNPYLSEGKQQEITKIAQKRQMEQGWSNEQTTAYQRELTQGFNQRAGLELSGTVLSESLANTAGGMLLGKTFKAFSQAGKSTTVKGAFTQTYKLTYKDFFKAGVVESVGSSVSQTTSRNELRTYPIFEKPSLNTINPLAPSKSISSQYAKNIGFGALTSTALSPLPIATSVRFPKTSKASQFALYMSDWGEFGGDVANSNTKRLVGKGILKETFTEPQIIIGAKSRPFALNTPVYFTTTQTQARSTQSNINIPQPSAPQEIIKSKEQRQYSTKGQFSGAFYFNQGALSISGTPSTNFIPSTTKSYPMAPQSKQPQTQSVSNLLGTKGGGSSTGSNTNNYPFEPFIEPPITPPPQIPPNQDVPIAPIINIPNINPDVPVYPEPNILPNTNVNTNVFNTAITPNINNWRPDIPPPFLPAFPLSTGAGNQRQRERKYYVDELGMGLNLFRSNILGTMNNRKEYMFKVPKSSKKSSFGFTMPKSKPVKSKSSKPAQRQQNTLFPNFGTKAPVFQFDSFGFDYFKKKGKKK